MSDYNKNNKLSPELKELAVDWIIFYRKWTAPKLAKILGVSPQALNQLVERREKHETK
jgi:plasmid maintenance system antidote protein VapI